jgi:DNA adenine methylase
VKPPVAYYGGKTTIASRIVALLPEHGHYVEPFAGSLAVLLAKPPSRMETVNDIDRDLMTFWRVLRDRPADLERACALTPHSRAEHRLAYQAADDELEHARRVWVRLTQGRAGTLRRTGWRHYQDPGRSYMSLPGYLRGYCGRIAAAAERLAMVSLECRPALEVIADYSRHRDVLLYVDPPYLAGTRTSVNYRHEMAAEADHRELSTVLHAAKSAVVLSGYDSDLYRELYGGWHRAEIATATGQAHAWNRRTEVLWSNRPLGAELRLFEDEPWPTTPGGGQAAGRSS